MTQLIVNIRIEEQNKKALESICDDLGISVATLFNMTVKKTIAEKAVPFQLKIDDDRDEALDFLEQHPNCLINKFKNMDELVADIKQTRRDRT
jgi:addiction module RelB/DinJ family antitoxin